MTELRECPFCGCDSADYMPDRLMAPGADPPVFCNECHASAMDAAAWNRRADDWQPIETAPRDGTEVLTWDGLSHQVLHWFDGGHESLWINEEGTPCEDPTHWRPLPKGPGG